VGGLGEGWEGGGVGVGRRGGGGTHRGLWPTSRRERVWPEVRV